ncbi:hypothetical protein, partial [Brevibacterium aurantiacum]
GHRNRGSLTTASLTLVPLDLKNSAAIKQIGKSKIKKATSKYLLQKANANTWKHIRAKKHNWGEDWRHLAIENCELNVSCYG